MKTIKKSFAVLLVSLIPFLSGAGTQWSGTNVSNLTIITGSGTTTWIGGNWMIVSNGSSLLYSQSNGVVSALLFSNITMSAAAIGGNSTINFGQNYNNPALILYDGGTAQRYGWGLKASEMQFFAQTGTHYSWNKGGDLQTSGVNELMRLDTTTGVLSGPSFSGNGNALTGTSATLTSSNASIVLSPSVSPLTGRTNYDASMAWTNLINQLVSLPTDFTSTNAFTPFFVTFTQPSNYLVQVEANAAGFATTDRPSLVAYCTNTTSAGSEWGFLGLTANQAYAVTYGYDEVSAGGYPYPLSTTGSGFPTGIPGINRLGYIGNNTGQNVQKIHFSATIRLRIDTAPFTLFFRCLNSNGSTTTNTLQAGSYIMTTFLN